MDNGHKIELNGLLWMAVGKQRLGGPGRIELLTRVAEHGSITKAAKAMAMSYKAAWDAIDQMNSLAGEPLVERTTGGKGGGSTHLTPRGRQLVANFRLIEAEHRRLLDQLNHQAAGLGQDLVLIRRLSMKTSARNQFVGTVSAIRAGAVNDEIEVEILGGQRIVATITGESTQSLGLAPGTEVFALIKAPSVIVMTGDRAAKLSAGNQLSGTIVRLKTGAVNSEVVIALPGGLTIAAIVTRDSADALGLATGKAATAIFQAASVIIGVAA
jgi:molybdate transport system regulatory protein